MLVQERAVYEVDGHTAFLEISCQVTEAERRKPEYRVVIGRPEIRVNQGNRYHLTRSGSQNLDFILKRLALRIDFIVESNPV